MFASIFTDEAGNKYVKTTNDAGIAILEEYYWQGEWHRPHEAGPAWIERNNAGIVTCEAFYWEGRLHRPHDAGPAWIKRNAVGMVTYEAYYWEDKWHRPPEDGPTFIERNDAGIVTSEAYYWEGKHIFGQDLRWARRKRLLNVLHAVWTKDGGKPGCTKEGLPHFLSLRRVCRFHPDPGLGHRLVEPFGQAVVAFL
jgi:hypothetical protein